MTVNDVIQLLAERGTDLNIERYKRYGIIPQNPLGVDATGLREVAKIIKKKHNFALELWDSGIHEVRILATMVADPKLLTKETANHWVKDFYSWDLCDSACMKLFAYSDLGHELVIEWSNNNEEYIKRAAFALIASLAIHDKKSPSNVFSNYFPVMLKNCTDKRNMVKKAVNWALRQTGKRNPELRAEALSVCNEMLALNNSTANWIAKDAIRELNDFNVIERVNKKK
ncbi:MAG: DNA alkylation repair protein [Ignavibacteriaceae bacterium]|nr:DNA alkylation repair protein [Ignavibacteriaceae bacterium]